MIVEMNFEVGMSMLYIINTRYENNNLIQHD